MSRSAQDSHQLVEWFLQSPQDGVSLITSNMSASSLTPVPSIVAFK